jgi:hypothetical protein
VHRRRGDSFLGQRGFDEPFGRDPIADGFVAHKTATRV